MSNQEFEVGDRVRLTTIESSGSGGLTPEDKGCVGKLVKFIDVNKSGKVFEVDFGTHTKEYSEMYFELISKGDETMEDVDAIAVDAESPQLRKAIVEKLKSENFSAFGNATFSNFVNGSKHNLKICKSKKECVLNTIRVRYSANESYDLGDSWNKVVEFLEQDDSFEINGHEVEKIDDITYKIGCYEFGVGYLENFIDKAEALNLSDDSTLKVEGEEVTLSQSKELLEWLEDQ